MTSGSGEHYPKTYELNQDQRFVTSYLQQPQLLQLQHTSELTTSELDSILSGAGASNVHQCRLCSYRTHKASHLKRHVLSHTGEKPYFCPLCPHRCNQNASLQRHILTHTKEKPFQCTMCDYRANQKITVEQHTKRHHGAFSTLPNWFFFFKVRYIILTIGIALRNETAFT